MVQSNYDILGIHEGASKNEIRQAFRQLVLQHHSDRGGDDERFKKIRQAFEDLKTGKKYPDSEKEINRRSRFYYSESEEQKRRRNAILSNDVSQEMELAQEWAAALNRADATGRRLFGSKELGQIEFERKPTKALTIKGKYWAGNFAYDGSIIMWGSITNPFFSDNEKHKTHIHVKNGKFSLIDPIENKYDIEGGAKITVDKGDIIVGDISGTKEQVPDPAGRVGMYKTMEHFTELRAPKGKIVAGNIRQTAKLEADEILVLNLVDNVKIRAKNISVLGSKVNYDVEFVLLKGGSIKFHDTGSGFDISDDATIILENGKKFRLRDLKTSKMISYGGKEITYEYLDALSQTKKNKKSTEKNKSRFASKIGGLFGTNSS